jgi:phage host-nuclease inhibitor protein Gam
MTTNNLSLDEFLDEADGVTQEVSTDFAVTDLASADWCLRKVESAERRIQQRRDFVTAYRAKLDAWLESANTADFRTTERMAELLQPWAEQEVAKSGGRQSISLPTGTVGFRRSPDALEVTDNERACLELDATGLQICTRVKIEVDKRALMAHIKNGGALPVGVELRQGERRFYVKAES